MRQRGQTSGNAEQQGEAAKLVLCRECLEGDRSERLEARIVARGDESAVLPQQEHCCRQCRGE
jgi:hypothetical protein